MDALALVLLLLLVDHLAHGGVDPIQGALVGPLVGVGQAHFRWRSDRAPLALDCVHLDHLLLVLLLLLQEARCPNALESLAP